MMWTRALAAVALALIAWKTFGEAIACDLGWEPYSSGCYKKMDAHNGWLGARFDCVLEGGDLVSITSSAEESFVKGKMGDDPFWIGLSNLKCGEKWCQHEVGGEKPTWSDNVPVSHTNWAPDQAPSSTSESCVYVNYNTLVSDQRDKWRFGSCESSLPFMCKRSPKGCQDGQPCSYKAAGYVFNPVQTSACDPGYFLFGFSCYRFEGTKTSWQAAEDHCKGWGGHLASLHSQEEGKWMRAHARNVVDVPWLGLKKTNNKFEFSDKTVAAKIWWHSTYPKNEQGNDCSLLSSFGLIFNAACTSPRPFICKKAKRQVPPPLQHSPGWSAKCGWLWLDNPRNDFCYLIQGTFPKTWMEARDDCVRHGSDLLSITDLSEQNFIFGYSKVLPTSLSLWLGATAASAEDGGKWVDRSPFSYINLDAGNPDAGRCLSFFTGNGYWKFDTCDNKRAYICKRRGMTAKPSLPHDDFAKLDICNKEDDSAKCPEGSVIRIQSAFYGWRSVDVCPADERPLERCSVEGALLHYRKACDDRHECNIKPMEKDTCPGVSKYHQMVYSCGQKECLQSLGNKQESLKRLSLSASSSLPGFTPDKSRLNGPGCWRPAVNPTSSWIQVNLGDMRKVTGIVIQSCPNSHYRYWTKVEMQHSMDRLTWTKHPKKFFTGKIQLLDMPVSAQYIRILLLENSADFGIRFDVLGCTPEHVMSCYDKPGSISFNGDPKTVFCPAGCAKFDHVYGTLVYTEDSNICAAALHAGVIQNEIGGECTLLRAPPQTVFASSTRNGITSTQYDHTTALAFTFADGEPKCSPSDWEEFAGSCYKPFEEKKTWVSAHRACRSLGAELVSIRSKVEQEWLTNALYFDSSNMWTGLNDLAVAGMFTWSDGHRVPFTYWASGEPTNLVNLNENCVAAVYYTGRWKQMSCTKLNSFMCKMPTAHSALASEVKPPVGQASPSCAITSSGLLVMSASKTDGFIVELKKSLHVNSIISIEGRGNPMADSLQVSLLNDDSTEIALQLKLILDTNMVMLTSKPSSKWGVLQQIELSKKIFPIRPGIDFKIVIQCAEEAFLVLIDDIYNMAYYYKEHDLQRITRLEVLGKVSLKDVMLDTKSA